MVQERNTRNSSWSVKELIAGLKDPEKVVADRGCSLKNVKRICKEFLEMRPGGPRGESLANRDLVDVMLMMLTGARKQRRIAVAFLKHCPMSPAAFHHYAAVFLWGSTRFLSSFGAFLPVLISARQEEHPVAKQAMIARQNVGDHSTVRVPQMWFIIDVVNRRGDVKAIH